MIGMRDIRGDFASHTFAHTCNLSRCNVTVSCVVMIVIHGDVLVMRDRKSVV